MRRKPTIVFVYLLGAYVLLQFLWWGYHLIDLTEELSTKNGTSKRVFMIIGEGSVFLVLLLFGLWKIKRSVQKEIQLARQQQNFMLSVTHELKTPIASTKLYLQTMLKHQLSEEKQLDILQKAIDETKRLEQLVEQILTAARLEKQNLALNKTAFSLNEFIETQVGIQTKRFAIPIQIEVFTPVQLHTDQLILGTILNNLIENAVKYAPSEKGIQIAVDVSEFEVNIQVKDFGPGISESDQRLLFKKFTRLENEETRSTKGTGLGLFIAYECAKALGGNVSYSRLPAGGSCFQINMSYE